ncbi:hypothetical protein NQ314_015082 [Rhamnusium bicolor]|uniref:Glucuronosyltransferase n=1 Tax=Rhamnusium bicolor TaxID=1586634 RepID=A0AAV8WZX6_9CUCU|nr:hypothetical protein NQ314_015082 [Rhamnusium bicolor]
MLLIRHPNIKLFISQGGIQSIEEAIFTHVPMVVMPFYGDQLKNARIVERKEFGKFVNHKPMLIKEGLKNAIVEVISNPK